MESQDADRTTSLETLTPEAPDPLGHVPWVHTLGAPEPPAPPGTLVDGRTGRVQRHPHKFPFESSLDSSFPKKGVSAGLDLVVRSPWFLRTGLGVPGRDECDARDVLNLECRTSFD